MEIGTILNVDKGNSITGIKIHTFNIFKDEISTSKKEKNKELTIPRLELLAVLIGIRAIKFVTKILRLKIARKILWTDSQCMLHWLKTKKPLSIFIENRIEEIKSERDVIFHYVATYHNPSDLATRGLSVQDIMCSSLWWYGPSWLHDDDTLWPAWNFSYVAPEVLQ